MKFKVFKNLRLLIFSTFVFISCSLFSSSLAFISNTKSYCVNDESNSTAGHVVFLIKRKSICDQLVVTESNNLQFYKFLESKDRGDAFFILNTDFKKYSKKQTITSNQKVVQEFYEKVNKLEYQIKFTKDLYRNYNTRKNERFFISTDCKSVKNTISESLNRLHFFQTSSVKLFDATDGVKTLLNNEQKAHHKKRIANNQWEIEGLKNQLSLIDCDSKFYLAKEKKIEELKAKSERNSNSKVRPLDEVLKEKYGDPKSEETKVTAKPKKKFQPKETISDDESPIIDIASVITVNDQAYTLKGKIKDKSGVYLTVDGRAVDLNKDEFEIERFSVNPDQQQKIKIVAIDDWNNKSEKTVTVKIDLSQNKVAKKYEDLKPNNIRRVKTDNNRIAIIIGIEKYQYLNNLDAKYANRDANAFRAYATRALGIPSSNVEVLVDDKATRTQILKTFKNNLRRLAGKKGKDIHIFFAGHGLASDNGEDLYILPQDGESSLLEDTAISRVELIELIQQVNPNSVTMYFDTCYSGQTRDEQLLVASLRPVRIVADEQETPDNFTIFTASDYDQTSGSIEEAKHGMFSYYLMKGLEGNADLNTDNKITNGELISYLKDNVSQEAFIQNRQQDPMFSGDPDKVLISYN